MNNEPIRCSDSDELEKMQDILNITPSGQNPLLYWHQVAMDAIQAREQNEKRRKNDCQELERLKRYEQNEHEHHGMDDSGNGGASTVVDVGHGAGNGTGCGDTSEEGCDDIGRSLGDEFHVAVVLVSGNAIGHGCTEETLNGTEDGNGEGHGHELLNQFESDVGHYHIGQLRLDLETVANGVNAGDAEELFHNEYGRGAEQNAIERAGNLVEYGNSAGDHGREDDEQQAADGHDEVPNIEGGDVLGIADPLADEIARRLQRNADGLTSLADRLLGETEDVAHLCSEDGDGNTGCETHDDGIGDELDERTQTERTQRHKDDSGQNGGDEQTLQSVFGIVDNTIYNNDESSRGTSDLYLGTSQQRNEETSDDGCDDSLLGRYATGNTKCDGKGKRHNTYNNASHEILHEHLAAVPPQTVYQ